MSIYHALQLAYASMQFETRRADLGHGSDQILGAHLVPVLRREQAELRRAFRAVIEDGEQHHDR